MALALRFEQLVGTGHSRHDADRQRRRCHVRPSRRRHPPGPGASRLFPSCSEALAFELCGREGNPVGPIYDCQQCGACCTNQECDPAIGYVNLTKDESKQMRRLAPTVVRDGGSSFLGTRAREGDGNPSCVALRGRVGGPCRCAIYLSRPLNCRQFEVGGNLCKAAREEAGLPV